MNTILLQAQGQGGGMGMIIMLVDFSLSGTSS